MRWNIALKVLTPLPRATVVTPVMCLQNSTVSLPWTRCFTNPVISIRRSRSEPTTRDDSTMTTSAVCANTARFVGHHFTGKERDAESGNDYFGARYYGSSMGRFLSPDEPFADFDPDNPQSWNLYGYVR